MDRLDEAATIVQLRARRARSTCAAALVAAGLLGGSVGYIVLRDWFLTHHGVSSPVAVATLTLLPVLASAFAVARPLGQWVVSARRSAWIEELAREHGVDPNDLEELTRF